MKSNGRHNNNWKQRATLALVMFFCVLISSAEYLTLLQQEVEHQKEIKELPESQTETETFFNIAVDAVVPFVTVLGQQVFHLIYETFKFEKPETGFQNISFPSTLPFWEILLERIISTNAP
ncbi:hypothetical protein [Cecembia lonarensis]|uniref:Uncharacterized protein n=1 Tax=Cecembia lonarensis (strain CCUG 58316 / KCTC 22772 / LW9) TaxID=1225176 RepID=K1LB25_CECL9|nr:hypothetical protein [Cecembia lonarensis]EKB49472.1 hypothetical protein B879_01869 [Cecembia lonarensis LW9]